MRTKGLTIGLLTVTLAVCVALLVPNNGLTAGTQTAGEKEAVKTGETGVEPGVTAEEGEKEPGQAAGQVMNEREPEDMAELEGRLQESIGVFQTMTTGEEKIPSQLIQNAAGIAIFPDLTKVALGVGGRYGGGVLMLNQQNEWTGPIFLSLYGASLGAQAGAEQTDLVMVFTNQDSLGDFSDGELQLGAEASVTAGEWGAKAGAATQADVLAYSDTEGLFAGAALSGAVLHADTENNRVFFEEEAPQRGYYEYEKVVTGQEKLPKTEKANPLIEAIQDYTKGQSSNQ